MKYVLLVILLVVACGKLIQGPPGAQGPAGTPGQSCSITTLQISQQTPNGGSLIVCPDGTQSLLLNGTNGTNGTVVAPVQLCPSTFVTTYPIIFVELAFCISGELYGVYSLHDGFMSLLPPGLYSSNGVNASCTFLIKPNCVVVPQ